MQEYATSIRVEPASINSYGGVRGETEQENDGMMKRSAASLPVPALIPGDDDDAPWWVACKDYLIREIYSEGEEAGRSSREDRGDDKEESCHSDQEDKDRTVDAEEEEEESEAMDSEIDIGEVEALLASVEKDPLAVPLDAGWRREIVTRYVSLPPFFALCV